MIYNINYSLNYLMFKNHFVFSNLIGLKVIKIKKDGKKFRN